MSQEKDNQGTEPDTDEMNLRAPVRNGGRNDPAECPGPPWALLAGEEDGGDEPHILRGID
ncbi:MULTISPECIES: hypothetical protein [unclassified Streptomyces]|uniref:hypothetical protein n=1 Tax=unclassified Streptomyces TaxID=2593676 RepID=UPI001F049E8F|nr:MULTISPECIES: hypothetical protein [unclassified Streptomyces]MCH0566310.1 hypothetical protein [Streptomyces sp. MUM 2J]MCH0572982.1 hypothetical protein [Streptomyces sp. MUM 136J]